MPVIAIASLIVVFVLLLFAPSVLGLIRQDVSTGLDYFPVAVYIYAAPVAFALLGISLLLVSYYQLEHIAMLRGFR